MPAGSQTRRTLPPSGPQSTPCVATGLRPVRPRLTGRASTELLRRSSERLTVRSRTFRGSRKRLKAYERRIRCRWKGGRACELIRSRMLS
jgi:hypothetical protein